MGSLKSLNPLVCFVPSAQAFILNSVTFLSFLFSGGSCFIMYAVLLKLFTMYYEHSWLGGPVLLLSGIAAVIGMTTPRWFITISGAQQHFAYLILLWTIYPLYAFTSVLAVLYCLHHAPQWFAFIGIINMGIGVFLVSGFFQLIPPKWHADTEHVYWLKQI